MPGRPRALVVVNPVAGRGRASRLWPRIHTALQGAIGPHNLAVETTSSPGEAATLAARGARDGFDFVIACGGDGTVHEVINGVAGSGYDTAVGVIPAGTGNDFARALGITKDPVAAAGGLAQPSIVRVDLGRVGNRFFGNVGGVGFDAEVAADVNRAGKRAGGAVPYVWGIIKKLVTYRNADLTVHLDGRPLRRRRLLVAVGVAAHYGGGMHILPGADMLDGRLDILIGGDLGKAATLALLPRIFRGTHVHHPLVETARARTVRVEGPENLHVHADGEVIGRLPVEFSCIPRGLPVVLPLGAGLAAGKGEPPGTGVIGARA